MQAVRVIDLARPQNAGRPASGAASGAGRATPA